MSRAGYPRAGYPARRGTFQVRTVPPVSGLSVRMNTPWSFSAAALQVAQPKSPGAGSGPGNTAAVIDDPELATSVFHREGYRGLIGLSVAADIGDRFKITREQMFPDGVGDGGVDRALKRCPDLEPDHRPQFLQ